MWFGFSVSLSICETFPCFHLKPWGINPSSTSYLSSLTHKAPCQRSILLLQLDLLWMDNDDWQHAMKRTAPGKCVFLDLYLLFVKHSRRWKQHTSCQTCTCGVHLWKQPRQKKFIYVYLWVKHPFIFPQSEYFNTLHSD